MPIHIQAICTRYHHCDDLIGCTRTYASNRLMFHFECLNSCTLCSTKSNSFFILFDNFARKTLLYILFVAVLPSPISVSISRLHPFVFSSFISISFALNFQCHLLVSGKPAVLWHQDDGNMQIMNMNDKCFPQN